MRSSIFEDQTASAVAQARAQAHPTALPPAERAARVAAQRTRLIDAAPPLEVAYSVYDVVSGVMQADALGYLHPPEGDRRAETSQGAQARCHGARHHGEGRTERPAMPSQQRRFT